MQSDRKKNEAVVLVHGIWMKGPELSRLSYNIKKKGYKTSCFVYRSLFRTPRQNAELLKQHMEKLDEPVIHLVCHSLGGIVALHMLAQHEYSRLGKIIMIGTPVKGSAVANYLNQRSWLRWLLGKSTEQGLLGNVPFPEDGQDIYMIAGYKGIGIGMFLASRAIKPNNDGTVNLEETEASFIKQHTRVAHGHFPILWSRQVIEKVIEILNDNK